MVLPFAWVVLPQRSAPFRCTANGKIGRAKNYEWLSTSNIYNSSFSNAASSEYHNVRNRHIGVLLMFTDPRFRGNQCELPILCKSWKPGQRQGVVNDDVVNGVFKLNKSVSIIIPQVRITNFYFSNRHEYYMDVSRTWTWNVRLSSRYVRCGERVICILV